MSPASHPAISGGEKTMQRVSGGHHCTGTRLTEAEGVDGEGVMETRGRGGERKKRGRGGEKGRRGEGEEREEEEGKGRGKEWGNRGRQRGGGGGKG